MAPYQGNFLTKTVIISMNIDYTNMAIISSTFCQKFDFLFIFFLPQLFLKVPLLILLLVKVPFFNMMSLEMVLAVSRKEAIIWLPAVINIYL